MKEAACVIARFHRLLSRCRCHCHCRHCRRRLLQLLPSSSSSSRVLHPLSRPRLCDARRLDERLPRRANTVSRNSSGGTVTDFAKRSSYNRVLLPLSPQKRYRGRNIRRQSAKKRYPSPARAQFTDLGRPTGRQVVLLYGFMMTTFYAGVIVQIKRQRGWSARGCSVNPAAIDLRAQPK